MIRKLLFCQKNKKSPFCMQVAYIRFASRMVEQTKMRFFYFFWAKKVVGGIMFFLPTDQITGGSFFDLGRFRGTLFSKIFQKWEYLMRPCGLDLKKSTWTCTKVPGTQDNCPFWTHIFQNSLRSEVRCVPFYVYTHIIITILV